MKLHQSELLVQSWMSVCSGFDTQRFVISCSRRQQEAGSEPTHHDTAAELKSEEVAHEWTGSVIAGGCNIELGCGDSSQEEFLDSEDEQGCGGSG